MLLCAAAVQAQAARDHDIVPDDYFTIDSLAAPVLSPSGDRVVYARARWVKDLDRRNTDLWVVDLRTRQNLRLTFDSASDHGAAWSSDGNHIYFLSSRSRPGDDQPPWNGKGQIWRIGARGNNIQPVTRISAGVSNFKMTRDGKTLYYVTRSEGVGEEWNALRTEYKDLEYGHGVTPFSQLWALDLGTWRHRKLANAKRVIRNFDVAPDGSRVFMVTTPDQHLVTHEGWSRIDVLDTASGEIETATAPGWRKSHPSPFGWIDGIRSSSDSKAAAFTISFDGYPTRVYVLEWDTAAPVLRELQRPPGVSIIGGSVQWRGDRRDICIVGEDHARSRVVSIRNVQRGQQGPHAILTPGDVTVSSFAFSIDGAVMTVVSGALDHAGDLYSVSQDGNMDRLTRVNPQIETWKLPVIEIVKWFGADGVPCEGILELPPDYQPGQRLPMIVEIHGGPTAATLYQFRLWIYGRAALPAKGYAVFSPNYRGSTGYGDEFMVQLVGRENDVDVKDILGGVDALIERGVADPERLGVMGWSNGGYLTNCLITQTDRFKVASSGAGVLDQVIQWGAEDTPGHVVNFMEGLPWSQADAYRNGSPIYQLDRVRTPTLIHVGEHDERVPATHARALYRALRHYLEVDTELLVYPGEGHGLSTYTHRKAKMAWDHAWFDKYLPPNAG
jgi:dipeptidyl aminopeptidase/acylaminoacyl peptidase